MTETTRKAFHWTRAKSLLLWTLSLVVGVGLGWLIHVAVTRPAAPAAVPTAAAPAPEAQPSLQQLADQQAAPLLESLKKNPTDAATLTNLGNIYYDAQQYQAAAGYYEQVLKQKPTDISVRTDMGTAYWFLGDANRALAEFDKVLAAAPNNANTRFNRGLVRLNGKHDTPGAIADWERLLKTNPNYEQRAKVEQMMADARNAKP